MIKLYTPQYNDLWFRKMLMEDEDTMSFNHAWGGTIDFPEEEWKVIITVRRSRQSGVARATCPD